MPSDETVEIVRGDPGLRRTGYVFAALFALIGCLELLFLKWWLGSLEQVAPDEAISQLRIMLYVAAGTGAVICFAAGIRMLLVARLVTRTKRYPPPGVPVLQDTQVRWGTSARWISAGAVAAGLALLAAGASLPWLVQRLLETLPS